MRYFDYQHNGTLGRIWSLFTGLYDVSEEFKTGKSKSYCDYSHTLEIVNAAISGSLSTSTESIEEFNLEAYECACSKNDKISKIKSADKYLYIVDEVGEDNENIGFGDISEKKIKSPENDFKDIESKLSFEENMCKLLDIRTNYLRKNGVDLLVILKSALCGIPDAIGELNTISDGNDMLSDIIKSLLEDASENLLLEEINKRL